MSDSQGQLNYLELAHLLELLSQEQGVYLWLEQYLERFDSLVEYSDSVEVEATETQEKQLA